MKWRPYCIVQMPAVLPMWQQLIMDLGNPHPRDVARALGIGTRSVYRYNRTGQAPRVVCLAVYWLTRWGRSQVHTQAVNDAALAAGYASALEDELDRTKRQLAQVLALNQHGASNDPIGQVRPPSR